MATDAALSQRPCGYGLSNAVRRDGGASAPSASVWPSALKTPAPPLRKWRRFHCPTLWPQRPYKATATGAALSRRPCGCGLSSAVRRGGGSIAPTPAAPTLRAAALRNGALFQRYARQAHPPLCASPFPANAAQVCKRAQPSPRRLCALRFCRSPSGQPMQPPLRSLSGKAKAARERRLYGSAAGCYTCGSESFSTGASSTLRTAQRAMTICVLADPTASTTV